MKKTYLAVIFFIAMVAFFVPLTQIESHLIKNAKGGAIFLQFAFTPERGEAIIDSWRDTLKDDAIRSLYIDFGFMVFYTLFLITIALKLRRKSYAMLTVIGCALDATENFLHLTAIRTYNMALITPVSIISMTKFTILFIVVILLVARIISHRRSLAHD